MKKSAFSSIVAARKAAFTLVEMLVTLTILVLLLGIGIPALLNAKTDAAAATQDGNSSQLNTAINRANIAGDTNPILTGSDVAATVAYLTEQGYLTVK